MAKPVSKKENVELEPDAWERFERAMKVIAKSPPQHREARKRKKSNKKK